MSSLQSAALFTVLILLCDWQCQKAVIAQSISPPSARGLQSYAKPQSTVIKVTGPVGYNDLHTSSILPGPRTWAGSSHDGTRIDAIWDAAAAASGRHLLQDQPQTHAAQSSGQPDSVIYAHNEADLAQAIASARAPGLTLILLPASVTLTQSLPTVTGPLQLLSAGGSALISCSVNSPAFTALTVTSDIFSMSGLTWAGCGGVISLTAVCQAVISNCSFQGNGSPSNVTVRTRRMS